MVRVAFIGVSHWHAPLYFIPASRLPGVRIVGVSDPEVQLVERIGRRLQAASYTEFREMLDAEKPELVFAFGRHCDMAEIGTALVDRGIPFIIEKPGGLTSAEVENVRDSAQAKGVYAGAGFNFRVSELFRVIRDTIADDPVTHASFRYIAGGPYRYREDNSTWMLDPALSGGGSTINLSVHFIDMFRAFSGSHPTEVAALLGNFTWGLDIEDYSSMILRSPSSICTIETGYTFPATQHGIFDLRFSIRTTRNYIIARSDNVLEVRTSGDGALKEYNTETSNLHMYPAFVADSVDRFSHGKPPLADLNQLCSVMEVVDAAFASNRNAGASTTVGG